ncbi:MAG: hypothetical protein DWI12_07185 [Planctomycetota bacterium]|nr:MAG: hypothetical protein DWI12_07185 [Planctomycetota bacterium]
MTSHDDPTRRDDAIASGFDLTRCPHSTLSPTDIMHLNPKRPRLATFTFTLIRISQTQARRACHNLRVRTDATAVTTGRTLHVCWHS